MQDHFNVEDHCIPYKTNDQEVVQCDDHFIESDNECGTDSRGSDSLATSGQQQSYERREKINALQRAIEQTENSNCARIKENFASSSGQSFEVFKEHSVNRIGFSGSIQNSKA